MRLFWQALTAVFLLTWIASVVANWNGEQHDTYVALLIASGAMARTYREKP